MGKRMPRRNREFFRGAGSREEEQESRIITEVRVDSHFDQSRKAEISVHTGEVWATGRNVILRCDG